MTNDHFNNASEVTGKDTEQSVAGITNQGKISVRKKYSIIGSVDM